MSQIYENEKSIESASKKMKSEFTLNTYAIAIEQVYDTVIFEFKRNKKKTLILMVVNTFLFLLFFMLQQLGENRGQPLPSTPADYSYSYMMMIDLIIIINSVSYGGYVISQDFSEKTGHILFPKIGRGRLLMGRTLGVYILNALTISTFYLEVMMVTASKYDGEVPVELFKSWGWTLLYTFVVLSFVIFWSSLLRSPSLAVIISLLVLWIVFSIIEGIMSITTTMEPVFILTYYGKIITAVFYWPEQRYSDQTIPIQGGDTLTIRTWITPSPDTALIGILIYSVLLLTLAYLRFKTRQFKN